MKRGLMAVVATVLAFVFALPCVAGDITGKYDAKRAKFRRDAVVYVETAEGNFPSQKQAPCCVMDQKDLVFVPHVLPVVRGTTVKFTNSDSVGHNVFSPDGEKYNLGTWPKGESKPYTYNNLGVYVQLCNVHPEMEAFIVVLQNPFFALTDSSGKFSIKDVPAGKYTLKLWHSKLKKKKSVEVTVLESDAVTVDF